MKKINIKYLNGKEEEVTCDFAGVMEWGYVIGYWKGSDIVNQRFISSQVIDTVNEALVDENK
ncbi:MAG: hypothetical protein WC390_09070 [Sulfurimonas sp.]|jgi:hypothetical protein